MLNEESRRKIRELKLDELVDILDDQERRLDVYASMSFDDRLSLAIDELYYQKNSKRSKRLISSAKLRYPDADINTLILEPRGLSKPRMIALAAESYLMDARNIIINGYTGAGKTYLSCAIAKEACRRLHKTRYVRMPKMLEEFNLAVPLPKKHAGGFTKPDMSECRRCWKNSIWRPRQDPASASLLNGTAPTICSSWMNGW